MAKKPRSAVLDRLSYGAVRVLLWVFSITPEWLVYPALDALGRIYLRCASRRRKIAIRNLRQAFGDTKSDDELRRLAIRSCGYNFMVIGDLARISRMLRTGQHFERVDSEEAFEFSRARMREFSNERAPIICSPHLGSWEVAGIQFARYADNAEIIARPLANPFMQRWIHDSRAQLGLRVHPRRGGVRKLYRALLEGRTVGLLPDQNQRTRGLFVEVFGRLASCDRSPVRLSQLTGAPIACMACFRVGRRYRFRFECSEVFEALPGEDGLVESTRRLQRAVEALILMHPEQYFWVHDRYRTRPPEERARGEVVSDVASPSARA